MRIDLLCNDGSPIGVIPDDIEGRGVGGAELAMLTLTEVLAQRGHTVTVFNEPRIVGEHRGVSFLPLEAYNNRTPRDVIIIFRSPNRRFNPAHMPPETRKIWWSTDQYTVGSFKALSEQVDFCVTISPFHRDFHIHQYKIDARKIGHIDLGVRTWEYPSGIDKVDGLLIFCSIPDRGLPILHAAWPLIKRDAPHASIVITSDYRLWGSHANNQQHRLAWAGLDDVQFLGAIPRSDLVGWQGKAEIMAYPSIYEELFCISAAECQVSGAMPVTTAVGALPTTNEFGLVIPGNPKIASWVNNFAARIASLLTDERDYLTQRREAMQAGARRRFDWTGIAERWESLFEEGKLR